MERGLLRRGGFGEKPPRSFFGRFDSSLNSLSADPLRDTNEDRGEQPE
jgi:hypothetical protein